MSSQHAQLRVVSEGDLRGRTYPLPRGSHLVGRGAEADVMVPCPDLSRRHAYVSWDGSTGAVADAGSTNGTAVNGVPITQTRRLESGDVVRLGTVDLRFERPGLDATRELAVVAPRQEWRNEIGGSNYGDIHQAGRDVNVRSWHEHHHGQDEAMDELFQGRGAGRLLLALGLVAALAGFALFAYFIFSAPMDPGSDPFARKILGLPEVAVGFGTFVLGGVIASIGMGMSKAARARAQAR